MVFGPLFHAINPGQECYIKPKYKVIVEQYFTALRLVYPNHKERLQRILDDDATKPGMKDLLRILRDLCEFMIPAVSML